MSTSAEEMLKGLTTDQKLKLTAQVLGFKSVPVDIDTFINDDYFMGGYYKNRIYPYWVDQLHDVYKNPIFTDYKIVVPKGAIGCIHGDTKIRLLDGSIQKIKDLYNKYPNGGFYVYSWDIDNNTWKPGLVTGVYYTGKKPTCTIEFKNLKVTTTLDHKFLLISGNYIEAMDLSIGDKIQSDIGYSEVLNIDLHKTIIDVYDMTVDTYHNYGICDSNNSLIFTHNTGKSTFSICMALYDLYKLSCLENLDQSFKLMKNTPISIRCFNMTKNKAYDVLIGPLLTQVNDCPYFQDYIKQYGHLPFNINIAPAKQATDVISECLIFSLVSEANFMKPWIAEDIITTSLSRMGSRLQMVEGIFGHILLDSSSTLKDSVVEKFLANNAYEDKTKVIQTAIWSAKAHMGYYFVHGSFNVYAGDGNIKPHIIEDGEDTSGYDEDRIIKVPEECRALFENDIIKALNDQAGISLDDRSEFISNKQSIKDAQKFHLDFDDELIVDFFDSENIYDIIGDDVLDLLPEDRVIYGRIDLGLVQDRCGISLGYLEEARYKEINERKVFEPTIAIPVSFALSRKDDQETSIDKIIDFFIWLSTHRHVAMVSTDQFQSANIRQRLKFNNIESLLLSVDRTDEAYVLTKNLLLLHRLHLCDSPILEYELSNLVRTSPTTIDHKSDGSKDIADSMSGVVKMIYDAGEDAARVPETVMVQQYTEALENLAERNKIKRNFNW